MVLLTLTSAGSAGRGIGGVGAVQDDGELERAAVDDRCAFALPCALGHGAIFFVLGSALSLHYATSGAARRRPRGALLAYAALILVLATADESMQRWVPDRAPQFNDWLVDLAAGTAGLGLGGFLLRPLLARLGRR